MKPLLCCWMSLLLLTSFSMQPASASTEGLICAGPGSSAAAPPAGVAAKPAQARTTGTRQALVLFARFQGEGQIQVPAWAADIFDPERPGSFSHFYDTMSFGRLQVRGQVAPRVYESAHEAGYYLAADDTTEGRYDQFALEILAQADPDLDFAQFDDDGPDGIPNSGDDDGVVDAVFLVLDTVPARFLRGPATGIGNLGFDEDMVTGDQGASGRPIRIVSQQGTVEQGRSFAGAMGAMCHEYGHVLGLIDLYNTDFLSKPGAPPEEDSAGVGAWDLMGWGALGWHGDDGPNSLSAWSRMELGWAEVEEVAQEAQEIRLPDVGQRGQLVKIPLTRLEYFLLEYRRRTSSYYDRTIPGEGLLVWHVELRPAEGGRGLHRVVELECADGRWQDAGYPLGRHPDPIHGGDNLDFWAHDAGYAQAHAGNLGDATDPFDGVRWTAFTPDTNPASYSHSGELSVRLEDIQLDGNAVVARVQTRPLLIHVRDVFQADADKDGIPLAGEEVRLGFTLSNEGGVRASDLRAVLRTDDPLVQVLQPEAGFGDLAVGGQVSKPSTGGFPAIRFDSTFAGTHTAALSLEVYAGQTLADESPILVTGVSPRQAIQRVNVVDSLGNGDGKAQPGEFIRLDLEIEAEQPDLLRIFQFRLHALDPAVVLVGSPEVVFGSIDGRSQSVVSPEFLLPADAPPGSRLSFVLETRKAGRVWTDTLAIRVYPGRDRTPPRILGLDMRQTAAGVLISLAPTQILDASPVRAVWAAVYAAADTARLATLPLARQGDRYAGTWPGQQAGTYLVQVAAEDTAGNQGRSALQPFSIVARTSSENTASPGPWEFLAFPGPGYRPSADALSIDPGSPQVMYARTDQAAWRSSDGGNTWDRMGLMGKWTILVDPEDPLTLYAGSEISSYPYPVSLRQLRSRDGGLTWDPMDAEAELMAVDPTRPGRLYGQREGRLMISEDRGDSWRATSASVEISSVLIIHPTEPRLVYFGTLGLPEWLNPDNPPQFLLWRSADAGQSWERLEPGRLFYSMVADSGDPQGLFATSRDTVWHSADRGSTWQVIQALRNLGTAPRTGELPGTGNYISLVAHPRAPGLLLGLSGTLWRSQDGGASWDRLVTPLNSANQVVLDPLNPDHFFVAGYRQGVAQSWLRTEDGGTSWEPMLLPEANLPAGTVGFDAGGRLWAGSGYSAEYGIPVPLIYTSGSGGRSWETKGGRPVTTIGGSFTGALPINALFQAPSDPLLLLARLAVPFLIRSTDGGDTWTEIQGVMGSSAPSPFLVDPQNPAVYYCAAYDGVFRSADFGQTWRKRLRNPRNPRDALNALVLDPLAPSTLYAAVEDSLWRSADEGATWQYAGQVADGHPILCLAIPPLAPRFMYAVTDAGLSVSADRARTWSLLAGPEIRGAFPVRLRFDPADPARILWGAGPQLLETTDNGRTWRSLGDDLAGAPWFDDVAIDPVDSKVIYAATPWGAYGLDTRQVFTAVMEAGPALPTRFALSQNYPNPFNPQTTILYQLPQAGPVRLTLYNVAGQVVRRLVDQVQGAGQYQVSWDGIDETGCELASGVYLYRLEAGQFHQTRRLVLLK